TSCTDWRLRPRMAAASVFVYWPHTTSSTTSRSGSGRASTASTTRSYRSRSISFRDAGVRNPSSKWTGSKESSLGIASAPIVPARFCTNSRGGDRLLVEALSQSSRVPAAEHRTLRGVPHREPLRVLTVLVVYPAFPVGVPRQVRAEMAMALGAMRLGLRRPRPVAATAMGPPEIPGVPAVFFDVGADVTGRGH